MVEQKWNQVSEFMARSYPHLDSRILVPWTRFHLTLGMLCLPTPDHLDHASRILQHVLDTDWTKVHANHHHDLGDDLDDGDGGLSLSLKGLEVMRGTRQSANVVYLDVHLSSGRVETMIKHVLDAFRGTGLLEVAHSDASGQAGDHGGDDEAVAFPKLHVTLINTKYARSNHLKKNSTRSRSRGGVDLSKLFEEFGDVEFGRVNVDQVQICSLTRHPTLKENQDKHQNRTYMDYYRVEHSIQLVPNK